MKIFFKVLPRHPIAFISLIILLLFYFGMLFSGFIAPFSANTRFPDKSGHPPTRFVFNSEELGFGLQVQKTMRVNDFTGEYVRLKGEYEKVHFFAKGEPYKLWGFISSEIHLFALPSGEPIFILGSDTLGRDLFSRSLHGSWVSLTVGIIGIGVTLVLSILIGGFAGYVGGSVDWILMRISELFILIPGLYLILMFRGLFSTEMGPSESYLLITIILSLVGWPATARIVRGMVHSIKRKDFVVNARLEKVPSVVILWRYIIPQISSLLIVMVALGIPGFILSETTLTYLSLGIAEPAVSWGSLIKEITLDNVAKYPWFLFPALNLLLVTLAFNFQADLLRDINDPHHKTGRGL